MDIRFQGLIKGVDISEVRRKDGKTYEVTDADSEVVLTDVLESTVTRMTVQEFVKRLNDHEYSVELTKLLAEGEYTNVEFETFGFSS